MSLPRLIEFEVMRGIAALQVVVVHYEYYFYVAKDYFAGPGIFRPYFPGAVGMVLFFVLSGFIISYRYFDELSNQGRNAIGRYVANRYVRLWPLHVTTLASVFLLSVPHSSGDGWSLLANATLTQALFPPDGKFYLYNAVAWSIGVEIVCYFGLIVFCVSTRWLNPAVLGVLGAALTYPAYLGFTSWTRPLAECHQYVGCGFQLLKYGSAFILGVALFLTLRVVDSIISARLRYVLKIASFAALGLFLTYGYLQHHWISGPNWPRTDSHWLVLSAVWVALAYLSRNIGIPHLRLVWLYWIGTASYSIYLWHNIVGLVVDRNVGSGLAYPVAIIATLVIGAVSYRLIEQPPRRWIARRLSRP